MKLHHVFMAHGGPSRIAALGALLLLAGGCTRPIGYRVADLEKGNRYCAEYNDYVKLCCPKALAIAGDPYGAFVSGLAYGGSTDPFEGDDQVADQAAAEKMALERCEARRVDRGISGTCVLQARGDCVPSESAFGACVAESSSAPRPCSGQDDASCLPSEACAPGASTR